MYDNRIIEPFTVIMSDNTAYTRIIPSENRIGVWHVEIYGGDDIPSADDVIKSHGRKPIFEKEVTFAQVLAFVPWSHWYVAGNPEDSFIHYLLSANAEVGWLDDEIGDLAASINNILDSDDPYNEDLVTDLRFKVNIAKTLHLTRIRCFQMFEKRGIDEDFETLEAAAFEEYRKNKIEHEARVAAIEQESQ